MKATIKAAELNRTPPLGVLPAEVTTLLIVRFDRLITSPTTLDNPCCPGPREAYGVREACFRFRRCSKAEASFTHSIRFAPFDRSSAFVKLRPIRASLRAGALIALLLQILVALPCRGAGTKVIINSDQVLIIDDKKVFPIGFTTPPPPEGKTPEGKNGIEELADAGATF